ncbi:DUF3078 domain-containing protein [Roseivirga pacifica]
MKKLILLCLTLAFSTTLFGQNADTVSIKKEGSLGFNFSNVGLSNWAAGGENSIALGTVYFTKVTRTKGKATWMNQFDFALGGAKVGDQDFRKTDDKLILASRYAHEFAPKWSYSIIGIFRTQLLEGNRFDEDPNNPGEEISTKISDFMAPGYLNINLGIDYEPNDILTASFAPAAGKFTFVSDDVLSAQGAFGVDPGEKFRAEFGTNLLIALDIPIAENISFNTTANFFTAYDSFGNVDVNWETLFTMKVNSWFNATFGTQLIYDDDILIDQGDGTSSREIQFKHVLNMGVNFNLFKKSE